jgi:hypothetical protein
MIEMAVGVIGVIVIATVAGWIWSGILWLFNSSPEFYRPGGHRGAARLSRVRRIPG